MDLRAFGRVEPLLVAPEVHVGLRPGSRPSRCAVPRRWRTADSRFFSMEMPNGSIAQGEAQSALAAGSGTSRNSCDFTWAEALAISTARAAQPWTLSRVRIVGGCESEAAIGDYTNADAQRLGVGALRQSCRSWSPASGYAHPRCGLRPGKRHAAWRFPAPMKRYLSSRSPSVMMISCRAGSWRTPVGITLKTVNLEDGMPSVAQARARLSTEIRSAQQSGVKVLKLIHGYGSTGIGGDLRVALQSTLRQMAQAHEIRIASMARIGVRATSALGSC